MAERAALELIVTVQVPGSMKRLGGRAGLVQRMSLLTEATVFEPGGATIESQAVLFFKDRRRERWA